MSVPFPFLLAIQNGVRFLRCAGVLIGMRNGGWAMKNVNEALDYLFGLIIKQAIITTEPIILVLRRRVP
jgi:hypothetical protein